MMMRPARPRSFALGLALCGASVLAHQPTVAVAQNAPPAQRPPVTDCMMAAKSFSVTDEKAIATVIACVGVQQAPHVLRMLAAQSPNAGDQARSKFVAKGAIDATTPSDAPIGYLVNGRVVPPDDQRARRAFAFGGTSLSDASVIPLTARNFAGVMNADKVAAERNNAALAAFNASSASQTAASNEAARQSSELNRGFCAYRTNSISAATGLVSLASNAATFTRSQLGILSLLAPIVFSKCENVSPPSKPVVSASANAVDTKTPATLTVTESNYTGAFTATASAQDAVDIALVPNANPVQFTVSVHSGFQGQGVPVTITISDDHGQSTIVAVSVTGS
ncbi:MAG TPA: hypothetical protein VHS78_06740 [Candidatus Elarobacter sp.]|jgi:hypothetical protein|nr:hypothetical protein [Candidatus Elarobacter sp.]